MSARSRGRASIGTILFVLLALAALGGSGAVLFASHQKHSGARARQGVAERAQRLFAELERDTQRLIPCAEVPPPLDRVATRAIAIDRPPPADDPERIADKLRLYVTMPGPDGGEQRAHVQYRLDQSGAGELELVPGPAGTKVGRLRRHVLGLSSAGQDGVAKAPQETPVLAEELVAFEVEWLAPGARAFRGPDDRTRNGEEFVLNGSVDVDDYTARPSRNQEGNVRFLSLLRPGADLWLRPVERGPAVARTVRLRSKVEGSGDEQRVKEVLLNERLDRRSNVPAWSFAPPAALRVSATFVLDTAGTAERVRVSRVFPLVN